MSLVTADKISYSVDDLLKYCETDSEEYDKLEKELTQMGIDIVTDTNIPIGIKANEDVVYTEINLRRNDKMNELIKAGEVFKLKDLLPYQEGKIVNMDFIHNDKMKFVVMSFDEGTALFKCLRMSEVPLNGELPSRFIGIEDNLPTDHYLWLAGQGRKLIRNEIPIPVDWPMRTN